MPPSLVRTRYTARPLARRTNEDPDKPLFTALSACLCLSIFQGYIFNLGINISLFLLCLIVSVRYIDWGVLVRYRFAAACLALILVQAISLSWSPDPFMGVKDISFGLSFIVVLGLALTLAERDFDRLIRAAQIYCTVALAQSLLVILFRLLPPVEAAFWASPIGALFISPGALGADGGLATSNVTDPDKAGGVLLAANVAGAWSAALGFLTIAVFRGTERTARMRLIAAIHFLAVYMSGSKASLGILTGIVVVLLLGWLLGGGADARKRALVWLLMLWIGMATYAIGIDRLIPESYSGNSKVALGTRTIMWGFAMEEFQRKTWQGLGYGGWKQQFFRIGEANLAKGVNGNLAPHNLFLDLWTQSGMFAVIAGAIIVVFAYGYVVGAFRRRDAMAACLLAALSAYILQSMGENYMLFSVAYVSPVLVLSVVLSLHGGVKAAPAVLLQQAR